MKRIKMYKIFELQKSGNIKPYTSVGYTYECDAIEVAVKSNNELDLIVMPVICNQK